MWFLPALAALFCWSGSDLFSKLGCERQDDRTSHLKMLTSVGLVMGLHAAFTALFGGVTVSLREIWAYLPVSFFYISSMALGYLGMRYIELSILSPVCNTSGAVVVILYLFCGERMEPVQYAAVILICLGVFGLALVEAREDESLRIQRQAAANRKYAKSALALALPIAYCLLDAAGTFADGFLIDRLGEEKANLAYELTFLAVGLFCFVLVYLRKREHFCWKEARPRLLGACLETGGQLAYVYAMGANPAAAAPMISAYCAVSVLWSRIFLREKLSPRHYFTITLAVIGIIILGVFDL